MSNQYLRLDFDEIRGKGGPMSNFPGPLSYYLLLRTYIWRSSERPQFPFAPPAHSAWLDGNLVAVLSDQKAASILGVDIRTIGRYRKVLLDLKWIHPVKPTYLREIRMWWLGYRESLYAGGKKIDKYFINPENLLKELISNDDEKTSKDSTILSHGADI